MSFYSIWFNGKLIRNDEEFMAEARPGLASIFGTDEEQKRYRTKSLEEDIGEPAVKLKPRLPWARDIVNKDVLEIYLKNREGIADGSIVRVKYDYDKIQVRIGLEHQLNMLVNQIEEHDHEGKYYKGKVFTIDDVFK